MKKDKKGCASKHVRAGNEGGKESNVCQNGKKKGMNGGNDDIAIARRGIEHQRLCLRATRQSIVFLRFEKVY